MHEEMVKGGTRDRECVKGCIQQNSKIIVPEDMSDPGNNDQLLASSSSQNPGHPSSGAHLSAATASQDDPQALETPVVPLMEKTVVWECDWIAWAKAKRAAKTREPGISVNKMMEKGGPGLPKIRVS